LSVALKALLWDVLMVVWMERLSVSQKGGMMVALMEIQTAVLKDWMMD
jgi:hypothetical protein